MVQYSQLVLCFLCVIAPCCLSLNIESGQGSLKAYKRFLDKYWNVITTLDSTVDGLIIKKSADQHQPEIAFDTTDSYKYHFVPVPPSGSMAFKVKAPNDVHISFAPDPYDLDPILEIFIGTEDNQKTTVRYNRTMPNVLELQTPEILDQDNFIDFKLKWGDGVYTAWRAGEPRPFVSWTQPDPFHTSFIGLRTAKGAKGSWAIQNVTVEDTPGPNVRPTSTASLHFRVRARNDAHVGLSTTSSLYGPILEIVIGGWSNRRSVIRRGNSVFGDKVGVDIPDFLNGTEYRGFWVTWGRVVSIGREGDACPFMSWTDPDPFEPKYVGIHTGFGSTGDWRIENMPDLYTPDNTEYKFFPVEQVTASSPTLDIRSNRGDIVSDLWS